MALSFLGGAALYDEGVRRTLALAVTPLLSIFELLPSARLERKGSFRKLAAAAMVSSLISTGATVLFAIYGASYVSGAYAGWIYVTLDALTLNVWGERYVSPRLGVARWRRTASECPCRSCSGRAELYRNGILLRRRYLETVEVITSILWPASA